MQVLIGFEVSIGPAVKIIVFNGLCAELNGGIYTIFAAFILAGY
jgi:hypothetical protein